MCHVLFLIGHEIVKRLLESAADGARRVFLEDDERLSATFGDCLKVFEGRIRLVRADFRDFQSAWRFP